MVSKLALRLIVAAALLFLCAFTTGCGRTQLAAPNRKLLAALQTAVSAKKTDWLEATATQLAEKKKSGEVSDAEYNAMNAIVVKARNGDWKGAQKDVFALSEGQRPTSADLTNVRERKAGKD